MRRASRPSVPIDPETPGPGPTASNRGLRVEALIGELQVVFPWAAVARHRPSRVELRERLFVAVPAHLAVGHLARVPARDTTLTEVDHRDRAGSVAGAVYRHRARNLR